LGHHERLTPRAISRNLLGPEVGLRSVGKKRKRIVVVDSEGGNISPRALLPGGGVLKTTHQNREWGKRMRKERGQGRSTPSFTFA